MPLDLESVRSAVAARAPLQHTSDPARRQAAVALILAPGGGGFDALLIVRAERAGDPWSGHVGLPGGRRADSDADLVATARRETREELGIELDAATYLGQLDDLAPTSRVLPSIVVRPFAFAVPRRPALAPNEEVADILWTPLAELARARQPARVVVHGEPRDVQGLPLGPHLLWGMTLQIVDGFLSLLAAAPETAHGPTPFGALP